MAAPIVRDLNKARNDFARWVFAHMPGATDVTISELRAPQGGTSSDTLFVEGEIKTRGASRKIDWVIRIQASAMQVYQDPSIEKQFRIMETLGRSDHVPVPQVLWLEHDPSLFGSSFFVMKRKQGRVVSQDYNASGWLFDLMPEARERLWLNAIETLAQLHKADVTQLEFLSRPELGATGLDQEIALWDRYFDWSRIPKHVTLMRAQQWLHDHAPVNRPTELAWGDAQLANIIFQDEACAAVIDWETVSLGGAEEDLSWWLVFDYGYSEMAGRARLPGLGDAAGTIRAYETFAGRRLLAMEWHQIFATWRVAMVSDRAVALYAASGHPIPGMAQGDGNPYIVRLARLLDES